MKEPQRIFWLGMHKILVQTELPRLRKLGYEVFNPPYLSSVKDQSACSEWDASQPTTLPAEIFNRLSRYNFFYNEIAPEIADVLNTYFSAVIVTISPKWLIEILKCYQGKVIYRVYGQRELLSQELEKKGLLYNISHRDNFWFVPHAREAVEDEHSWLREREEIVPYCLSEDVFHFSDTWESIYPKKSQIALSCPNIKDCYFYEHYKFLKSNFSDPDYLYYGVQLGQSKDPQVVGTLSRQAQLAAFQQSSGYLYTYSDGRVCYLPPIEMMVLGGPVLYLKGSLLDRYFTLDAPGRCSSIEEAHSKCQRLIQNDQSFIREVIAAQKAIRERYIPTRVWPIFDNVFRTILTGENRAPSWLVQGKKDLSNECKRIYVFHHFPGTPIVSKRGIYSSCEGIPRVVRQIVGILSTESDVEVVVTARPDQIAVMNGYFRHDVNTKDRVRILCTHPSDNILCPSDGIFDNVVNFTRRCYWKGKRGIKRVGKVFLPVRWHARAQHALAVMELCVRNLAYLFYMNKKNNVSYVDLINKDDYCAFVFVTHYYAFPESVLLKKKIILYLPDYVPHFFHHTGEFALNEGTDTKLGKWLAQRADKILCNSNFTKNYLPYCRLNVSSDKIHVCYLPCLNSVSQRETICEKEIAEIVRSKSYVFYPTQARPNKNLSLLLRVFNSLVEEGFDMHLILTGSFRYEPKTSALLHSLKHQNRVILLNSVVDDDLVCLYRNAAVLCVTSLAEGNFPPQIHEALKYDTPVVASRLGFITERIPEYLNDALILCEPNNEREFVEGCKRAMHDRANVLARQKELLKVIEGQSVVSAFHDTVLKVFNL